MYLSIFDKINNEACVCIYNHIKQALTAYGLMEFKDMAQVFDVDKEMITRTTKWLNSKRDGKGIFGTVLTDICNTPMSIIV